MVGEVTTSTDTARMLDTDTILDVRDLRTHFTVEEGVIPAVDGVSFHVRKGETLGIVGESGCGKSVTALSLLQLVQGPRGRVVGGEILYRKKSGDIVDIAALRPDGQGIRGIRGPEIAMIFQEPMTSLNPLWTIGDQITESLIFHRILDPEAARKKAIDLLGMIGFSNPERRMNTYPHELSGGMRQRVMAAMALSCDPQILIADEPTTALDVTVEAQILELMRELQREFGMAIIIITHDMGVIAEMADRVVVMYTGKVAETSPVDDLFYSPLHPYTKGLLMSIPRVGISERLVPIRGSVPPMSELPVGCYFAPRCPNAMDKCSTTPRLFEPSPEHFVNCWLYENSKEEDEFTE